MRPPEIALVAALICAAAPALAAPAITLNGVAIDGVTAQRIENATVVIDEKGAVHIAAPGYAVKTAGAPAPPAAGPVVVPAALAAPAGAGQLTRRYFLVTEHAAPGTQFDLAIFINSQWIREVKASEPQVVMEITRHLRPGANRLVLATTKRVQEERRSTSPEVALSVVVGEGNVGGDHVAIDSPLVEASRTAAETQDRTEEFLLEAR